MSICEQASNRLHYVLDLKNKYKINDSFSYVNLSRGKNSNKRDKKVGI